MLFDAAVGPGIVSSSIGDPLGRGHNRILQPLQISPQESENFLTIVSSPREEPCDRSYALRRALCWLRRVTVGISFSHLSLTNHLHYERHLADASGIQLELVQCPLSILTPFELGIPHVTHELEAGVLSRLPPKL